MAICGLVGLLPQLEDTIQVMAAYRILLHMFLKRKQEVGSLAFHVSFKTIVILLCFPTNPIADSTFTSRISFSRDDIQSSEKLTEIFNNIYLEVGDGWNF